MVTIQKGDFKFICTNNTYEDIYKSQGYQIVPNKKGAVQESAPLKISEEKDNQEKIEDETEKNVLKLESIDKGLNQEAYGITSKNKSKK